jgi:hypothetical protein
MIEKLWKDADGILQEAIDVVDEIAGGDWKGDNIRTQPITDAILSKYGLKGNG